MPTTITGQFTITHEATENKPYKCALGGLEITVWADKLPKGPHGNALPPAGQIITAQITSTQKGRYQNNYLDSWEYAGQATAPQHSQPAAVAPSVTPSNPVPHASTPPQTIITTCFIQACEDARSQRKLEGAKLDPFADQDDDVLKRFECLMNTYKLILAEYAV